MAAPEYVPAKPMDEVRAYESPPRRPGSWLARRPGDLQTGQPHGRNFGNPGPDQGYALRLASLVKDRIRLQPGEDLDDVIHGAVPVALKRAAMMGRAPVVHDLLIAFRVWGFLDDEPDAELVRLRREVFGEVAHAGHYRERLRIAALVPETTLRMTPGEVERAHASDWRSLLDV